MRHEKYIYKSHKESVSICHIAYPAKYRRLVFGEEMKNVF